MNTPAKLSILGHLPTVATFKNHALEQENRVSFVFNKFQSQEFASPDPHGNVFRRIRLTHGVDPVALATAACISVSQYYQLESGETSLFHSRITRTISARRVATLLAADWDAIVNGTFDTSDLVILPDAPEPDKRPRIKRELLLKEPDRIGRLKPVSKVSTIRDTVSRDAALDVSTSIVAIECTDSEVLKPLPDRSEQAPHELSLGQLLKRVSS